MAYYHILKERRTNLKLSIQDVSNQTRLAPQYIQAIEEHNLDVFSDDFSFVRYFVHAYCDAIGVNWQAIADEVDMDINEVAHQKDMALTMAQRRMVEQMASVQKKKKKSSTKKKKSWFQKHVSRTSSSLSTNQSQLIKVLVLIGIAGLCVLSVINFGLRAISNQKLQTQEALRQEQLSKKEDETNAYQLSNIQSDVKKLDLSITLPTKSKITVTKDGETINDDTKVYTGTFTQSLELSENCTFEISIETYSDNSITIDGKEISFDKTDWQEGQPAIITLQVGKGNQKETEEYSQYDDSGYDYGYSDEYYGQEGDYTYDQNEYTEQTNDY